MHADLPPFSQCPISPCHWLIGIGWGGGDKHISIPFFSLPLSACKQSRLFPIGAFLPWTFSSTPLPRNHITPIDCCSPEKSPVQHNMQSKWICRRVMIHTDPRLHLIKGCGRLYKIYRHPSLGFFSIASIHFFSIRQTITSLPHSHRQHGSHTD